MTNENTAMAGAVAQPKKHPILKRVLLCIIVVTVWPLVMKLPTSIHIILLTAAVIGYLYPAIVGLGSGTKNAVKGAKRAVTRFSRVAASLSNMSDEEFDARFPASNRKEFGPSSSEPAHSSAQQQAPSFIPSFLCKPIMNDEAAFAAALAWWESESEDGTTGMQRVDEVISEISYEDPSKHTCVLTDHDEIRLPSEVQVLSALIKVMKANGLDADFNEDGTIIVHWNQYADGTEAAQAHTEPVAVQEYE